MRIAALIVAAGRGLRAGAGAPKQYRKIRGEALLTRTIRAMLDSELIDQALVCIRPEDAERYKTAAPADDRLLPPVHGGAERALSVRAGLEALASDPPDLVLIHDAARPFVPSRVIAAICDALKTHDGAIAAIPVVDALTRSERGFCGETVPRENLWRAQTPQGFKFDAILAAHRKNADPNAPDDAEVAKATGFSVALVEGDENNFKVTTAQGFERAEERLGMAEMRVGQGYDVHAFTEGDGVVLCGVMIPHEKALSGHSDADVAMHALTDALFGAIGEGDIGRWFPPSDPQWKGSASAIFLEKALERLRARQGRLINADLTLICELPKIGPHAEAMTASLARIMKVDPGRISIKATTSERLGFVGREEGVAAMATVLVALS